MKCVLKSDNFKSLRQSIARKYVAAIQHDEKKENVCNSRSSIGLQLLSLRYVVNVTRNVRLPLQNPPAPL